MPDIGKVLDTGMKSNDAQSTMGRILRPNGKVIHFINTSADLQKDDPIIFNILPYNIEYNGKNIRMPVAVLVEGYNEIELKGSNAGKWKKQDIHVLWQSIWDKVDDKLNNLGFDHNNWKDYRRYRRNKCI